MIEAALGIVGFAIGYIQAPTWMRPAFRPFTCGFCVSWWLAWLVWAVDPSVAGLAQVGLATLIAAVVGYYMPEIFYDPRSEGLAREAQVRDAAQPRGLQGGVGETMLADDPEAMAVVPGMESQALERTDAR